MSDPRCGDLEPNDAWSGPVTRLDPFDTVFEASPWPQLMFGHDGRVLAASDEREGERPVDGLRARAPHYLACLRGPEPWLEPQEARAASVAPDGRMQHERLFLRRMPWGSCLTIVPPEENRDPQTERLAALGFMVAGVCHEIANPLTSLHSVVQILRADPPPAPDMLDKGLRNIAVNVRRILDISRRLTTFARVGDEPRVAFPVDEAVDEALVVLRHEGLLQAVDLVRERAPRAVVVGNVGQAREVFLNLLLNAVHAMAGPGRLRVRTRRDGHHVEVRVADSGPGVPEPLRERIFEPFFTTKRDGQGTGLGLAISREIVLAHGGSLGVTGGDDGGAEFIVRFPAAAP